MKKCFVIIALAVVSGCGGGGGSASVVPQHATGSDALSYQPLADGDVWNYRCSVPVGNATLDAAISVSAYGPVNGHDAFKLMASVPNAAAAMPKYELLYNDSQGNGYLVGDNYSNGTVMTYASMLGIPAAPQPNQQITTTDSTGASETATYAGQSAQTVPAGSFSTAEFTTPDGSASDNYYYAKGVGLVRFDVPSESGIVSCALTSNTLH